MVSVVLKNKQMRRKEKKATALVIIIGISIAVFLFLLVSLSFLYNKFSLSVRSARHISLLYLAEGGVHRAIYEIKTTDTPANQLNFFLDGEDINITITPKPTTQYPDRYQVVSKANYDRRSTSYGRKQAMITAHIDKLGNTVKIVGWITPAINIK